MNVQLQNDTTVVILSRQLLDVGNDIVSINSETKKITFTYNFCNIVNSTKELVDKEFQSIKTNYQNHA